MSTDCKKQHFIPQHFLKSFVIPDGKDRLWMFRRGNPKGVPTARKRAAAQEYFYSNPSVDGSPTLDKLVTTYEDRLVPMVNDARQLKVGEKLEAKQIAEVVTHLSIRSSHIREIIRQLVEDMADRVSSVVLGWKGGALSQLPKHRVPTRVYKKLADALRERGLLDQTVVSVQQAINLVYFIIRERGSERFESATSQLSGVLEMVFQDAPKFGKRAQISILQQSMAPEARINQLSSFLWHVVPAPLGGAILPDCTSIAYDGKSWGSLFFVGHSDLRAVALPLAPNRIALGVVEGQAAPDMGDFNKWAIESSYSFFLSSFNSEELAAQCVSVGERLRSATGDFVGGAVTKTMESFFDYELTEDEEKEIEHASAQSWIKDGSPELLSFSLSLRDFGDDVLVKDVSEKLKAIVTAFSKYFPVASLDGFTFAFDLNETLNGIERGFEEKKKIAISIDKYRTSLGVPLRIKVEDQIRTHIVLHASVAVALVSEIDDEMVFAQSVVVHMLADSALSELMVNKFPQKMLIPIDDTYEAFLYGYCAGVFDAYFCASLSSWSDEIVAEYEGIALTVFEQAFARILVERQAYFQEGELDKLFSQSSHLISDILSSMARLFGARKARNLSSAEDSPLARLLVDRGLNQWAELFAADLEDFDAGLENWANLSEIFFVHRHFERLLAHFGIVPDRTEGPGAYIHVLWRADAETLHNQGST
ncbi:MAG: DUF4238 domain-containing protein [Rhodospirillaceae bacterium]|nr:DUF4238 domain-containing protein [Rhodospirillaceae bacterium]